MKPIRLMSGFLTVGMWTLLSRVLGFVRDAMIAAYIGPGPVMDAFVAAFRLPNMFRRFFAEGAFNMAFVPMFAKKLEADETPAGFASDALSGLGFVLLILSALAMVFMPALVWATANGFVGDARFDMTVDFGRVMFPYILFISLAALFSGVLNAAGHFTAAAAAPVLLNILVCTAMIATSIIGGDLTTALIYSIPVAGIAQLALVWIAAQRAGFHIRPHWPRLTPDLKRLTIIAIPAALAGGVMQVNLLVGQLVSSQYSGAISWLYSADRLYQLPLGVVGIAIGVVLLPDLSRRLKAGDETGSRDALSRAAEGSLALTIPAAVALIAVPLPLVSVLFERGSFGPDDSAATAVAVAIYGLGLPAFVVQKILQPVFFAREDTRSPFRYAVWAMIVNAVIAIGLAPYIGWIAAAIATTVAAWAMVIFLTFGARRFGAVARYDARFHARIWRIIAASLLMGLLLKGTMLLISPFFGIAGLRYLVLLFLIAVGIVSYFGIGQIIGAFRLAEFKRTLRRK